MKFAKKLLAIVAWSIFTSSVCLITSTEATNSVTRQHVSAVTTFNRSNTKLTQCEWPYTNDTKLKTIDLSHNQIGEIKICVTLVHAKKLILSHNVIKVLDLTFLEFLPALVALDLSHNLIASLESRFQIHLPLPELKRLDLSHNKFIEIERTGHFLLLRELKLLSLSSNPLHTIELARLPVSLRYLGLSNTSLEHVKSSHHVTNLTVTFVDVPAMKKCNFLRSVAEIWLVNTGLEVRCSKNETGRQCFSSLYANMLSYTAKYGDDPVCLEDKTHATMGLDSFEYFFVVLAGILVLLSFVKFLQCLENRVRTRQIEKQYQVSCDQLEPYRENPLAVLDTTAFKDRFLPMEVVCEAIPVNGSEVILKANLRVVTDSEPPGTSGTSGVDNPGVEVESGGETEELLEQKSPPPPQQESAPHDLPPKYIPSPDYSLKKVRFQTDTV